MGNSKRIETNDKSSTKNHRWEMFDRSKNIESIFADWLDEVNKDLKKKDSFWTPSLITSGQEVRTVVLRSIQMGPRFPAFIIHTDIRSKKWGELKSNPAMTLHFYCPKRKWQVRLKGTASLTHLETASTIEWKRLSKHSQKIYSLINIPGSIVDDPQEAYQFSENVDDGLNNFGVINFLPHLVESLQLSRPDREDFHVRSVWDIKKNQFQFLAP
jgi:hypothetical protein